MKFVGTVIDRSWVRAKGWDGAGIHQTCLKPRIFSDEVPMMNIINRQMLRFRRGLSLFMPRMTEYMCPLVEAGIALDELIEEK